MPFEQDHIRVDVTLQGPTSIQPATCTLWYESQGASPNVGTLDTYTNEISEFMATAWAGVLPTTCFFGQIKARWQLGSDEHIVHSTNASTAGTVASSDVLPEEDCVILRRYTGDTARDRHGRIFVPFVPETFQASGRLNSTAITAYQALAAVLKVPPTGDDITGDGLTLQPMHPSFKTSILHVVTQWALVLDIHNRRDRRMPKVSVVTGA